MRFLLSQDPTESASLPQTIRKLRNLQTCSLDEFVGIKEGHFSSAQTHLQGHTPETTATLIKIAQLPTVAWARLCKLSQVAALQGPDHSSATQHLHFSLLRVLQPEM